MNQINLFTNGIKNKETVSGSESLTLSSGEFRGRSEPMPPDLVTSTTTSMSSERSSFNMFEVVQAPLESLIATSAVLILKETTNPAYPRSKTLKTEQRAKDILL
jgi:hypothetical protein